MIFDEYITACCDFGLEPGHLDQASLAPASELYIPFTQWREAAIMAKKSGLRWCAFWVQELEFGLEAYACLEKEGAYLLLRTVFSADDTLPSMVEAFPLADRSERHSHDLLGVNFDEQPDSRRWTRHQAWGKHTFPLRLENSASLPTEPTRPDSNYPFIKAQGASVTEVPVGPVHAGIIEPGHFRFQVIGETVLNLEERLGYVHKGIEKIAVGRDAAGLARLAGRVSGDSTVAHCWAACQAMERAVKLELPQRALWLRAVLAERERVANHLGDIGGICNDVGFAFGQNQLTRLRESCLRENASVFGHRLLMDCIVPAGVSRDMHEDAVAGMIESASTLAPEVTEIIDILEATESLEDRLMGTGRLTPELAGELGVVGYVGRASGLNFDVRRNAPYGPYGQFDFAVPCYRAGDVAARARIRAEEITASLNLIVQLLKSLPPGAHRIDWNDAQDSCAGIGFVEGWRGEIITYIRFDEAARVARFYPRDPSWLNWPALELLMQGNIVPDFPVCNKSVNNSYSGHDL